MKELSIEEKARRYDEALEKFDVILNLNTVKESGTIFVDDVRKIFPELKESEDEKMKEKLIAYFKNLSDAYSLEPSEINIKKAIAWIEKQAEHANFLSKIQVGDKVTRNEAGILVNISQLNRVAKPAKRQRGQKSTDKVEPKFQNGQWIVWQNKCYKVNDNGCGYELIDQNGLSTSLEYRTIDESAHLWDIGK